MEFYFGFHRFRLHNKHNKVVNPTSGGETGQSVIVMSAMDQTTHVILLWNCWRPILYSDLPSTKSACKIWRSFDIMLKLI